MKLLLYKFCFIFSGKITIKWTNTTRIYRHRRPVRRSRRGRYNVAKGRLILLTLPHLATLPFCYISMPLPRLCMRLTIFCCSRHFIYYILSYIYISEKRSKVYNSRWKYCLIINFIFVVPFIWKFNTNVELDLSEISQLLWEDLNTMWNWNMTINLCLLLGEGKYMENILCLSQFCCLKYSKNTFFW